MNSQSIWKPAAIGGILLGVLSAIPVINCGCCAWVLGGGLLASYLFIRESPEVVALSQGAMLGILAGIIGTAVFALFQIPLFFIPSESLNFQDQLRQAMDIWPSFPQESRDQMLELANKKEFVVFFYALFIVFQLVAHCLLAMLGGLLGVAMFEKRKPAGPPSAGPVNDEAEQIPPPPPSED